MKISVVMPSYNQGCFIEESIKSVLSQDYQDFELIIMDAVSSDETKDVLARYKNDPRVQIYVEKDKGQADALAKGFSKCTGQIFAWLNSDDVYAAGAFATVAACFSSAPDLDVLNGELDVIDVASNRIARWPRKKISARQWFHYPQTIGQPSTFFSRRIYKAAGGVNPAYSYAMDYDLFFRFAKAGAAFHYIDECLAFFRVHGQSKTMALPYKFWREEISIFYKLSNKKLLSGFYYWKFRGMLSTIIKQKVLNSRKY